MISSINSMIPSMPSSSMSMPLHHQPQQHPSNVLKNSSTTKSSQHQEQQRPIPITSNAAVGPAAGATNIPRGIKSIPKKPMRPLTAYHIFFQIEREYVIQTTAGEDADKSIHNNKVYLPDVPRRYAAIKLLPDWYAGPGKRAKRKHRKQHGKIGFLELSRVISTRWAKLDEIDPETKVFVQKIAQRELDEYYQEMKEYKELTKDMVPPPDAVLKTKKKAKRRNSIVRKSFSLPAQQQQQQQPMMQRHCPDMVYSSSSSFQALDFISPSSALLQNDINYMLSCIESKSQYLLSRPDGFNRGVPPAQKKQRMCHPQQDSSFSVSHFDPLMEVSKFVEKPEVMRTVSNGSSRSGPSAQIEVDICDDEILQLWKAHN